MLGFSPDRIRKRIQAVYELDTRREVRQSYKNEQVQSLYREYLGQPGSHRAHELLHTRYAARPRR
jgi:NADP-reducing hydrogenase subunit HndD